MKKIKSKHRTQKHAEWERRRLEKKYGRKVRIVSRRNARGTRSVRGQLFTFEITRKKSEARKAKGKKSTRKTAKQPETPPRNGVTLKPGISTLPQPGKARTIDTLADYYEESDHDFETEELGTGVDYNGEE